MLHPYNNSTKKLLSLVPAVVFTGHFTRFKSTSPLVSVALRQELTQKAASRPLFVCARRLTPLFFIRYVVSH